MDFDRLNLDLKDLRRRNRNLSLAVVGLFCALVLAQAAITQLLGATRTIVVPPVIQKTFWVEGNRASAEYLEQMAAFVAWLVLDVSPASIDWKKNVLLGYVEPAQYGALKTRQDVEAERLKRINATTSFAPQQLVPTEDTQSVLVHGRLRTLVNGVEVANETKSYRVVFAFSGARMHLTTFEEVPHDDK